MIKGGKPTQSDGQVKKKNKERKERTIHKKKDFEEKIRQGDGNINYEGIEKELRAMRIKAYVYEKNGVTIKDRASYFKGILEDLKSMIPNNAWTFILFQPKDASVNNVIQYTLHLVYVADQEDYIPKIDQDGFTNSEYLSEAERIMKNIPFKTLINYFRAPKEVKVDGL